MSHGVALAPFPYLRLVLYYAKKMPLIRYAILHQDVVFLGAAFHQDVAFSGLLLPGR